VQRVHDAFRDSGVTVLAISIDGTGAQAVKPVMVEGKFTFAAPIDQDMNVARQFGVRAVPMTYVIDRSGTIVAQGFGPVDFDAPAFREFVKAVAARGS
jgi:peroxiredoxin